MADEKKPGSVVDPQDGTKHGWWGASPTHKDRAGYTVAKQGPIAEEAAQGGARSAGVGSVDKSAAEKQAPRRVVAKETDK